MVAGRVKAARIDKDHGEKAGGSEGEAQIARLGMLNDGAETDAFVKIGLAQEVVVGLRRDAGGIVFASALDVGFDDGSGGEDLRLFPGFPFENTLE